MKTILAGLVLALASLPVLAGPTASPAANGCYRIEAVFDPALPAGAVEQEMDRLRTAAGRGSDEAAYLLGTLYRLGTTHPAARLAHDPEAARTWLRKAALGGNLMAMAGLAENELSAGRPMDAMVLAQALIHYSAKIPGKGASMSKKYQAGLVARAFEALGQPPNASTDARILAAFRQFVAEHGVSIEAAAPAQAGDGEAGQAQPGACPPSHDNARWPVQYQGRSHVMGPARLNNLSAPGFALFHVQIKPNGRVQQALIVDSLPGPDVATALRKTVEDLRFNKLRGAPPRFALAPSSS